MKFVWFLLVAAVFAGACGPSVGPGAKGSAYASPSPSPSVAASPTPIGVPLDVSNSTPLIHFRDAAMVGQVDGLTWDGVVGTAPGVPDYHASNPSETLFGFPTEILDRRGAVVNRANFGLKSFQATWADDDVHYCLMQPFDYLGANGVPTTLYVGSSEGGSRAVAQVGTISEQTTTYVASCSFEADRAVVVHSGGQGIGVAQYWMVQVSTGKVLWTHDFAAGNAPTAVVASHDTRYVAENLDSQSGAQTSTIYAGDGSKVVQLNASVAAFSWDGSAVVLFSRQAPQPAWVARLQGGQVLWSAPTASGMYVWSTKAQPNGGGLAVALADSTVPSTAQTNGYPPVDLYLIAADGRLVTVLRKVYW